MGGAPDDAGETLRYPVGRFAPRGPTEQDERRPLIAAIREFPADLAEVLAGLQPGAVDTAYRPGGWTVRQLVHHLSDSHLNAYTRFRLALTEDHPTIRPYDQERWAELPDASTHGVEASLSLLQGLHARWAALLDSLPPGAFARTLHHPESGDTHLDDLLQHYAWHGRHHLAHIRGVSAHPGPETPPLP